MDMTEFFKGIVDTEEDPIVICDLDYKIIYVNPSAIEYYKKAGEMTGKHLHTFLDEEMMSKVTMTLECSRRMKRTTTFSLSMTM